MKNISFTFLAMVISITCSAFSQVYDQGRCEYNGFVCRAKSWSTKEARGIGRPKPTEMEAKESARIECRSYVRKIFPNFLPDYCEREIEFECVQTVLKN